MMFHGTSRGGLADLSQLVSEQSALTTFKASSADALKATTAEIERLLRRKSELQCELLRREERLAAVSRVKFQADSAAEYRSGSFDGDFLIDDLAERIRSLRDTLAAIDLKITDTAAERSEHMRLFANVEERLGEIAEEIKAICG